MVERIDSVQSAAFSLWVPAGSNYDGENKRGTACLLAELLFRGAGQWASRELLTELDRLGVQNEEQVTPSHIIISGACLARRLPEVLKLYATVVTSPHCASAKQDPQQFETAAMSLEQSLLSVEDEPRQKVVQELKRYSYPAPWGLPTEGALDDLPNIVPTDVERHFETHFSAREAILAIAGNVTLADVLPVLNQHWTGWQARPAVTVSALPPVGGKHHFSKQTNQTQIGVAFRSVPFSDPDYFAAWATVSILSGGMSSRLFTEVREKRGLCYSVYASLHALRNEARVLCYAGTKPERAAETLEVMVAELWRIGEGIEEAELNRCKALAKSSLIMAQESTSSRAAAVARDWSLLGRVLPLAEIRARVESLTSGQIVDFANRFPPRDLTIVTIGAEELPELPVRSAQHAAVSVGGR